ncbi:MAG: tetratricopeptide repeat protein [Alphaproteobacteria bacterium]|nr:tetratricopeptide repeat protein [Alphaproteobacteria bacterium]
MRVTMSLREVFKRLFGRSDKRLEMAAKLNDVGTVLAQRGMLEEAIVNFSGAAKLDPKVPAFWSNLGNALNSIGETEAALKCFEKGRKLKNAPAHLFDNWGGALSGAGRFHEALDAHKKAVALDPGMADALCNLGNTYRAIGRLDDALMNLDAAAAMAPDSKTIASARLYTMNFVENLSPEEIADAHRSWPVPDSPQPAPFANTLDPDRILRVGYVSADFRRHSCAHFLLPLLERHDRAAVHVTAFKSGQASDEFTAKFKQVFDSWVDIGVVSHQDFASEVRSRSIDILIDCGGHTSDTRLSTFAMRAAPVQVSWLGYPHTTGLAAMDAHLTDAVATPPEMAPLFAEKLIALPNGFHTYRPLKGSAQLSPPPSESNGYVTYGAFHNLAKISDSALRLWASILISVPDSRIMVKTKSFLDARVRAEFETRCARFGIDSARLETRSWTPPDQDHFADFEGVDVVLDATPYNGTTTTCEALWMGVPVVTLCGDRPAGRVGASLLTQIGHQEWIAETDEEYVRIAADLADDQSRLVEIRKTLRAELQRSPLGDAALFARSVESAYRSLWHNWCSKQKA